MKQIMKLLRMDTQEIQRVPGILYGFGTSARCVQRGGMRPNHVVTSIADQTGGGIVHFLKFADMCHFEMSIRP